MHLASVAFLLMSSSAVYGGDLLSLSAPIGSSVEIPCSLPDDKASIAFTSVEWSHELTGNLATVLWRNISSDPEISLSQPNRFSVTDGNWSLTVNKAQLSDSITYTCLINYSVLDGSNTTSLTLQSVVHLKIFDVPDAPPRKVNASATSHDRIDVEWNAPHSQYPVTAYTVTASAEDNAHDVRRVNVSHSQLSAELVGLSSYTRYNVSVAAANPAGIGEAVTTYVRTKSKAPSVSPELINTSTTPRSIDVRFRIINEEKNGPLRGFVVTVWNDSKLITNSTESDISLTNFMLPDLCPDTNYTIESYVYNEIGHGPPLHFVARTDQGPPPEPQVLDTSSASPTSVRIVWRRPKCPNVLIKAYIIYWHQHSGNISGKYEKTLGSVEKNTLHSHTINGLLPCTKYDLHVTAKNDVEGPHQAPREASTEVKAPSEPNITRLVPGNNSRSFEIEWTPPKEFCSEQIDRYKLVYNASDSSSSISINISGNRTKFLVTNLTSSHYKVHIAAESKSKKRYGDYIQGPFSAVKTIHLEDAGIGDDDALAIIVGVVLGVVCTAFIIGLFFLILYLFKKKFYRRYVRSPYEEEGDPESVRLTKLPVTFPQYATNNKKDERHPDDMVKVSVLVDKWRSHVARLHADDDFGFSEEYQEIDCNSREELSVTASIDPINKSKNRYINILAYEHSRVLLRNIPGKPGSDYINANYVDGYHKPKAYIATQGPLPNTFADFWRMVWEQNSSTIVMITNLTERSKRKCDQYWPKEEEQQVSYDHMQVRLLNTYKMAHYTVRVFTLRNTKLKKKSLGERVVLQYHYTDWPDHGVPDYTLPTLTFIRKSVTANSESSSGPMIIHCSAGVGRTGTYIVIESMMRQMKDKGTINVFSFLSHIRTQRNQLVQTEDQYIFIHDALLEYIESGDTEVKENCITRYLEELHAENPDGETLLSHQYRLVTSFRPYDFHTQSALLKVNVKKNRDDTLLPVELSRVRLPNRPGEEGSDFISASYLQGYNKNEEFIITQHPLAATLEDFWRMVWEHNSMTIVLLQSSNRLDPECGPFWPGENDKMDCGHFKVTFIEEKKEAKFITRDLILQSTQDDYECTTRIVSTQGWPESCEPLSEAFDLIQTVQKWHHQHELEMEGPIIVIDKFGGTLAATFCALFTFYDQHLHEGVIDVYTAAKLYHLKRPGVWSSKEDYLLLYRALESLFGEGSLASEKDSGIGNCKDSYATMPAIRHSILKTINKAVSRTSEVTL